MESIFNAKTRDYNQYAMQEIGRTIVTDPQRIIDLLESNDLDVDPFSSPILLGDTYLTELPFSDGLQLGTAYLIERQNSSSFDGEIDNDNIYAIFDELSDYWDEDYEPMSNALGPVGAIAGALGSGADLTSKIIESKNKKKYGGLDMAQKQAESRTALIQGIIAQKKAEAEASQKKAEIESKSKKNLTIAIVSVVGILAIVGVVFMIKKRKNG